MIRFGASSVNNIKKLERVDKLRNLLNTELQCEKKRQIFDRQIIGLILIKLFVLNFELFFLEQIELILSAGNVLVNTLDFIRIFFLVFWRGRNGLYLGHIAAGMSGTTVFAEHLRRTRGQVADGRHCRLRRTRLLFFATVAFGQILLQLLLNDLGVVRMAGVYAHR
ncbi:hypothetical protein BpHYR1_046342 [Brachionus plicatilis]|uniref:Uncharacterized protein n=1 Tax=Brachionus plicatilis TaxID=10195 RepID=A0A3M7PHK5_BRAPC|nr:hypothetical protein BpHYR1_046342 [Brachionus plicatilis]